MFQLELDKFEGLLRSENICTCRSCLHWRKIEMAIPANANAEIKAPTPPYASPMSASSLQLANPSNDTMKIGRTARKTSNENAATQAETTKSFRLRNRSTPKP